MTITRIRGNDNATQEQNLSSNMRSDCSYTGKLLEPIKIGKPVFLEKDNVIFCTGNVVSKKNSIFRTLNGFYEIKY